MHDDLDIRLKGYMRDYLTMLMREETKKARVFGYVPAIIIRDVELDKFVDTLWEEMVLKDYERQKVEKLNRDLETQP